MNGEKLLGESNWVTDKGVFATVYFYENIDETYSVWIIRAENEPDAIKKVFTGNYIECVHFIQEEYGNDCRVQIQRYKSKK